MPAIKTGFYVFTIFEYLRIAGIKLLCTSNIKIETYDI